MPNGKGDAPRNCFSKQYRKNYDKINWKRQKMFGNEISKKEAMKGLGDPCTWDNFSKSVYNEFTKKPKQYYKCFSCDNKIDIFIEGPKCRVCGCCKKCGCQHL